MDVQHKPLCVNVTSQIFCYAYLIFYVYSFILDIVSMSSDRHMYLLYLLPHFPLKYLATFLPYNMLTYFFFKILWARFEQRF
jgi:hypothetical protein